MSSSHSTTVDRAAVAVTRVVRGETIHVEAWGPGAVRVRATHGRIRDDLPHALLDRPAPAAAARVIVDEDGTARIENGAIHATLDAGGTVTLSAPDGTELLAEEGWAGARQFGDAGHGYLRITQSFRAYPGERLFGLGQHTHGFLDQKGMSVDLVQSNAQVSIPFLVSSRGYGLLWNSPAVGRVNLGHDATRWVSDAARQVDYWVTAGRPAQVLASYADATGHPSPFPSWAGGLWQSKLRYADAKELMAVADGYADRGLPLSVLVIDYFSWTRMGDWRLDPQAWPDLPGLVAELDRRGIGLVASVWPTVSPISENVDEMRDLRLLVRRGSAAAELTLFPDHGLSAPTAMYFLDATEPRARAYLAEKLEANYLDAGVRALWLDACEPEVAPERVTELTYAAGPGVEVANVYPRDHTQGVFELMTGRGDTAPLALVRSAWAGSQRYGALLWSGDIQSTWQSLREQLRAGLNVAMSGIPWWTTDTGGFHGGDPDDPGYRELLVRWLQWMVFSPVLRLHGHREPRGAFVAGHLGGPNEPWSYGPDAERVLTAQIALRERLRPYLEMLMAEASATGLPPMRPLFVDFPDDERSWAVDDAYLFGPALLVAPVLEAGATSRRVWLPAGAGWTDASDGTAHSGGREVDVPVTADRIPVFLRTDGVDATLREAAAAAVLAELRHPLASGRTPATTGLP